MIAKYISQYLEINVEYLFWDLHNDIYVMRKLVNINDSTNMKQQRWQQLFNNSNQNRKDILDLIDEYRFRPSDHQYAYHIIAELVNLIFEDSDFSDFMMNIRDQRWGKSWDLFLEHHCMDVPSTRWVRNENQQKLLIQFYQFYEYVMKEKGINQLYHVDLLFDTNIK